MTELTIRFIGYTAAVFTTLSFIPQVIQVIKTKDTKSISLLMYIAFMIGLFLWLTYGIIKKDPPIIIANAVTTILASIILYYKIKFP